MRCSRKLSIVVAGTALVLSAAAAKKDRPENPPPTAEEVAKAEFLSKRAELKAQQAANAAAKKVAAAATPVPAVAEKKKGNRKSAEAVAPAAAEEKPPEKKKKTKANEEEDSEEKPLPKLSIPLPKGQDSKGVTIPYKDANGKKTMNFRIGVARRIDDEQIRMSDLLIEMYDDEGEVEMTVSLPQSMLNIEQRVITGEERASADGKIERVTIKRSDFEITGRTMEFNTETKEGHLIGNIRMLIHDMTLDGSPAAAKPEARP